MQGTAFSKTTPSKTTFMIANFNCDDYDVARYIKRVNVEILNIYNLKQRRADTERVRMNSVHTFHIPVMGTGFTIDSPLKVARFGISSVVSLVDDELIEQMCEYHSNLQGLEYAHIAKKDEDHRARRITKYLNLLNKLVNKQVEALRQEAFTPESDITAYFEMLPDNTLKSSYEAMLSCDDGDEKERMQNELRTHIIPGTIDVNIMTKLDRDNYSRGELLPPEQSDAMAALRGYANSDVSSSIIMSAGLNMRLYTYIGSFDDFFADANGKLKKKVVIKVSDYRSALTQGKFLAKRGVWVSEYRIESGLNCGGHAFATKGLLLAPILEEFKQQKENLSGMVIQAYNKSLEKKDRPQITDPFAIKLTVQGGIGTHDEDTMIRDYFEFDGTGWGTPFLLCPEVTNVDDEHIAKLQQATSDDVYLSDASPLGIHFWNLKTSASEQQRKQRIADGKPGSACPKGFLVSNTEFTKNPICHASHAFQKKKLLKLKGPDEATDIKLEKLLEYTVAKSCICHDLAGAATVKLNIDPSATTVVCCGPNISNFTKIVTLKEMASHIYGRISIMTNNDRPNMFIREISLYIDFLKSEIDKTAVGLSEQTPKYFEEFQANLLKGIEYYQTLANDQIKKGKQTFIEDLNRLKETILQMPIVSCAVTGG